MKHSWIAGVILAAGHSAALAAPETALWYERPAVSWESEALPLGNGRLGAMVFGGVEVDRFQLNIEDLWTGDENPSGAYNTRGEYRTLGNLFLLGPDDGPGNARVSCASGHQPFFPHEGVDRSVDGDPDTKWCVEHGERPVVWEVSRAGGSDSPPTSYALVSASDVPGRDPGTWTFEGSDDGTEWTVLDRQLNQAPADRKGRKAIGEG